MTGSQRPRPSAGAPASSRSRAARGGRRPLSRGLRLPRRLTVLEIDVALALLVALLLVLLAPGLAIVLMVAGLTLAVCAASLGIGTLRRLRARPGRRRRPAAAREQQRRRRPTR